MSAEDVDMSEYVLELLSALRLPPTASDESTGARSALVSVGNDLSSAASEGFERQRTVGYQQGSLLEILETVQMRNSTAEQVIQNIKAINDRSRASAVETLEKIDGIYSASLVRLVEDGAETLANMQNKFHHVMSKQREEFGKAYDCSLLLEYGIEARYQQLKTAIESVMKRSFERSNSRFDEVAALDRQHFDWTVEELRKVKAKWENNDKKRSDKHKLCNEKLLKVSDSTVELANKASRAMYRKRMAKRRAHQSGFDFRQQTCRTLNDWALETIRNTDEMYLSLTQSISAEIERLYSLQTKLFLYEQDLSAFNYDSSEKSRAQARNDTERAEFESLNRSLLKYVGIDFSAVVLSDCDIDVDADREGNKLLLPSVANLRHNIRKAHFDDIKYEVIDENNIFRQLGLVKDSVAENNNSSSSKDQDGEAESNKDDEMIQYNDSFYTAVERNENGCRLGSRVRWLSEVVDVGHEEVSELLMDILFGEVHS